MSYPVSEKDNVITVLIERNRIDTNSASEFEADMNEVLEGKSLSSLILDASKIEYVSSAGLRIFLKLMKRYPSVSMINVCAELYDILDMTGFTEMMKVEKGMKPFDITGCTVLGAGAKGIVYRVNEDTIIKVYKNPDSLPLIKKERELARKAFVLGVPTAISYDIVKVGETYGSVFELLDCNSISKEIAEHPERIGDYSKMFADLLKTIHSTPVSPADMPDIKIRVRKWITWDKEVLSTEIIEKISALVEAVSSPQTMIHCDYHTNNVMLQKGEPILIDMDTLSYGHPVFELANIYVAYIGFGLVNPSMTADFMGLPYDTCCDFYFRFLKDYFSGCTEEELAFRTKQVELAGSMRLLSHYQRRKATCDDEENQKYIEVAKQNIERLIPEVNTLEF